MDERRRRIFGDHLSAFCSMVLLSWLLLGAAIAFVGTRPGPVDTAWFALLIILIFPHTPTAFATLLTEGPSLLSRRPGCCCGLRLCGRKTLTPGTFAQLTWARF